MYKLLFFFLFIASAITLNAQTAIKPMWDKWLYRFVGQDAVFSSDGSRIITYTMQGLSVWDAKNGSFLHNISAPHKRIGRYIFSDSLIVFHAQNLNDNTDSVEVWNYYTAKRLCSVPAYRPRSITLDKQRKYVAICEEDKKAFKIWDVRTGALFQTISTDPYSVNTASFNSDASLVAYQTYDTIYVHNIAENRIVNKFNTNNWFVPYLFGNKTNTLAYTDEQKVKTIFRDALTGVKEGEIETIKEVFALGIPEKNNCIIGKYDTIIHIWDIQTGETIRTFKGFNRQIEYIHFNADTTLLMASDGVSVCIWDFKTAELKKKFSFEGEKYGIAQNVSLFSGTDILITLLHKETSVFDINTGEKKLTLKGFSAADNIVCNEGRDEIVVKSVEVLERYSLSAGVLSDKLETNRERPHELFTTLSKNGKYVFNIEYADDTIHYSFVNTVTKAKLWTFSAINSFVGQRAELSRNNNRIAVFNKPFIIIYDSLGNIINEINDQYGLSNFFLDAEGNTLFIHANETTYLFDINTDKYIHWFNGTSTSPESLNEVSGKLITTGATTLDIYNIHTGKLLNSIEYSGKIPAIQVHPTEDKILMFDKEKHSISVINAESGSTIFTIYDTTAVYVNYDPKGKFIYSFADGVNPKLYSAANGKHLAELVGAGEGITNVQLSDIGNYAIGAGRNLIVWDLRNINTTSLQNEDIEHGVKTSALNIFCSDKQLTIRINENIETQKNYTVYNIVGDVLAKGYIPANKHEFTLELNNYSNGIYYFETKINGKSYVQKFSLYQ